MKQLVRSIAPLIVALATFPALVHAQGRLAVEVYPGAVAVNRQPGEPLDCGRVRASADQSAFLSKDDAAKVGAFYKPKAKNVYENAQYASLSYAVDEWMTGEGAAWAGAEVYGGADVWTKGDFPLFDDLRLEIDGENHTEEDYGEIYAHYKYLNTAFFNCSDERDESGALLDEAEAAIRGYTESRRAEGNDLNMSADDLEAKIQKLVSEGRLEEAAKLGQQFASRATETVEADHWDEVVALIQELGKKAYRTLIVITPPRGQ